jgi:hypothetical protein
MLRCTEEKIDRYSDKKTASEEAIFKGEQDKQLTFHVEHFSGCRHVRSRIIHFNNWLPIHRVWRLVAEHIAYILSLRAATIGDASNPCLEAHINTVLQSRSGVFKSPFGIFLTIKVPVSTTSNTCVVIFKFHPKVRLNTFHFFTWFAFIICFHNSADIL